MFPSVFVGHGSPTVILEKDRYYNDLVSFARSIEKPSYIISVSAHWERNLPLLVSEAEQPPQIFDFYGFPEEMYRVKWKPKGSPDLAKRVISEFSKHNIVVKGSRSWGIDHGTWIPLSIMYPGADIPTIQISTPRHADTQTLMKMGEILRVFREDNILVFGSGNVVHNFEYIRSLRPETKHNTPFDWAVTFDEWIEENSEVRENMLMYRKKAPYVERAVATTEHFNPYLVVLGTMHGKESVQKITDVFHWESIAMRSVAVTS